MSGNSALYYEQQQKNAVRDIGIPFIQPFSGPGHFLTSAGVPLSGSGDARAGAATASNLPIVLFVTAADAADIAVLPWQVPAIYAKDVDRLEMFADFVVAAGAAVAGAGGLANFVDRPQAERGDHGDDFVLGHLQAATNDPAGAAFAIVERAIVHGTPEENDLEAGDG